MQTKFNLFGLYLGTRFGIRVNFIQAKKLILIQIILLLTLNLKADKVSEAIYHYLNPEIEGLSFKIDSRQLNSTHEVLQFYKKRNYSAAWINKNTPAWTCRTLISITPGKSKDNAMQTFTILDNKGIELLDYILNIESHGLNPADYHFFLIADYLQKTTSWVPIESMDLMKIDILLTDAFLTMGSHLFYGKADSEKDIFNWKLKHRSPGLNMLHQLDEAMAYGSVSGVLNLLIPSHIWYSRMKEELVFFRSLKNKPWPVIPVYIKIKPGDNHPMLPEIRKRLLQLRYLLHDTVSEAFDPEMEVQLKLFQADRGIDVDGIVDKETTHALNITPEELVNQLIVNMERCRWLPVIKPEKYIAVNIPNFELVMLNGKDTIITMKAVVGTKERATPVFNAKMTYIVFNPGWTLPPTILQNDVVPQLLKGSDYIDKKKMKIYKNNGHEIAYNEIDWSKITKENFPYSIKQEPGYGNALGKIKFMFPNTHSIYIHDTPTKWSFTRSDRTFSSGCIRVQDPIDLSTVLLSDVEGWSADKIKNTIQQNNSQTVRLKTQVEVYIYYLTAWAEKNGRIQFRNDVYHQDELVLKELHK